ncbi:MAG: SUMF1/EgtB/PvdO family nonheme iron enzyme [Gemmataceae bacterium]
MRPATPPQRPRRWLPVALGAGALALLLAGIVIILTNKDGSKTTIELPDDTKVEVKKDGKTVAKIDPEPDKGKEKIQPIPVKPVVAKEDGVDYAAERKAAEWMLGIEKAGNGYVVASNAQGQSVQFPDGKLPETPFFLTGVNIGPGADIDDAAFAVLAKCRRLQRIHVFTHKFTDKGLAVIRDLSQLQSLQLNQTSVGDGIAEVLARTPALMNLNLAHTNVTPAGLAGLKHCPRLQTVELPRGLDDKTNTLLATHCRELRRLGVHEPHAVRPALLVGLPRLRDLMISGEHLKDGRDVETIKALLAMPFLDTLQVEPPMSDALLAKLKPLAGKLRKLTIMGYYDWDPGVKPEGWKSLEALTELEDLHIGGTNSSLDGPGLVRLAELKNLRSLWVDFRPSGQKYTAADGAAFRRKRPEVEFQVNLGNEKLIYPRLDDWPGRFEGRTEIVPWNLPKDSPPPAVAPFTAEQAKKHQEAWAAHLKLPVEETSKATGMKFRLIPPGDYETTFPTTRTLSEFGPAALLRVDQPFHLGTHEVTFAQFEKFVSATGYKTEAERGSVPVGKEGNWRNPGYTVRPNSPVGRVTYADAVAFCDWLSRQDGAIYRLPTEWEWELAARAGQTGPYPFGSNKHDLAKYAWVKDTLDSEVIEPRPVGQKQANAFGLYDVVGNQWELCRPSRRGADAVEARYALRGESYLGPLSGPATWWPADGTVYPNVGFRVLRQTTNEPAFPKFGEKPVLVRRGDGLSPQATVSRPAAIPGVRSWSVEMAGHNSPVPTIAWSPKGDLIATGGEHDSSVRLWDRDGRLKAILLGHEGRVNPVSFSADGSLLSSCDMIQRSPGRGSLRVWDVATGTCRAVVPYAHWSWSCVFAPVGRRIAVASSPAFILDLDTGGRVELPEAGGHAYLSWSPDGKRLFLGNEGGFLAVYNSATGVKIATLTDPDWAEGKPTQVSSVGWSADGKWLAAAFRYEKAIRIWDAATHKHVRTIKVTGNPLALAWNNDNRRLAVGLDSGKLWEVIDAVDGKSIGQGDSGIGYDIAWSPDGKELAIPGSPPAIFDAATGKRVRVGAERGLAWVGAVLASQILSSDGKRVTFKGNQQVREFDTETGPMLERRDTVGGHLFAADPAGRWLLTSSSKEGEVLLVPREPGFTPRSLIGPHGWNWRTNADGSRLAVPSGKQALIYDTKTGAKTALEHAADVKCVAWSRDGQRLATVADKAVHVWDAASSKPLGTYKEFPEPPAGVEPNADLLCWDADGRRLWVVCGLHITALDLTTGRSSGWDNVSNGNLIHAITQAADGDRMLVREGYGWTFLRDAFTAEKRLLGQWLGARPAWHPDARRFLGAEPAFGVRGFDTRRNHRLGTLWPVVTGDNWICIGPDGHWRGSPGVEEHIVYVAQLEDGSQRTYTPKEFAEKFGWKNDPAKARLLAIDPPPQK